MRQWIVLGLGLLIVAALVVRHVVRSSPPLAVTVSRSSVERGESLQIRIAATRRVAPMPSFDLYLMSVFSPEAKYVTPWGSWSAAPVPLRTRARLGHLEPVVVEWSAEAVGWTALGVLAVTSGGDPLDRAGWAAPPEVRWIRVRPPPAEGGQSWLVLGGLALLTLGCVAIVVVYPKRDEDPV